MSEEPGTDPITAVGALAEPIRRRLYEHVVGQHDAVGREDAAAALGIGRPLAAFHLDRLARDGLLDVEYRRRSGRTGPGAGRPAKLYRRSRRELAVSLPERRYAVAAELFAKALESGGEAPVEALTAVARDYGLGLALSARASTTVPPGGRAGSAILSDVGGLGAPDAGRAELLGVLRDAGFEPAVDAAGAIRLRNCPFDALVAEHRQIICGLNLATLESVRDGLGTQGLAPVPRTEPGYCCVAFEPKTNESA